MELDDAQLKMELDDIMNRIDGIMKKVESLDGAAAPDCSKGIQGSMQDCPSGQL